MLEFLQHDDTGALPQNEAVAAAMAEPNVAKFVTGEIRRVIFVPGRMVNLVV